MGHHLGLVIDNTFTCSTFRVSDASIYQDGQTIANGLLEITIPNGKCPIIFNVVKDFNLILNVNTLHITQTVNFEKYNLPDGAYKIRYSINPNTTLFTERIYFRTCKLDKSLNSNIKKLFRDECSIKKSEFESRQHELIEFQLKIKAARIFAEEYKDLKKAADLYNDVNSQLKSIDLTTC